jgi:hypothetical protein
VGRRELVVTEGPQVGPEALNPALNEHRPKEASNPLEQRPLRQFLVVIAAAGAIIAGLVFGLTAACGGGATTTPTSVTVNSGGAGGHEDDE